MKEGDALGPYRLVAPLGRGGFAEVWRARLEPARAKGLPAHDQLPTLRVLAKVLRGERPRRSKVVANLLENLELLSTTQESPGANAPSAVVDAQEALIGGVLDWLDQDELLEGGALDVALKVPFHDGYVRQLRREKDILKRVEHANLVEQYAVNVLHDPPYLVMERIDGWSLRDALKTEPLPPMKKILAVMDQLLTVLGYLHRRGMVHGDVKPENVVMQRDGALRLIDLGLGQVSQAVMRDVYLSLSLASRVPLLGTLSYMAPEVRRGDPAGPESDLYSAGIVLYEMLVGDVPTGMALPTEAAADRQLTQRFDVLLKWILHPEPGRRIASAEEFRERVLVALNPRARHQLGTGEKKAKPRPGTLDFDQWALEAASPFVQGDWLGEYQLAEPVGRGGFGEVWRAHPGPESATHGQVEEVALKISIGPRGKDALAKEQEIAGRLDHPCIPKVLEGHLEHDPPYLVVDFLRGVSLRQALNEQGRLEPADAVIVVGSLAQALLHCHAQGILHQDVKPENLLLNDVEGSVHLLDFGLATVGDALPAEEVEVSKHLRTKDAEGGTYEYMAPERKQGGESTAAADVYSAGVVLFELLTGQLPRGLTKLRELCPAAPGALEALCMRMLAVTPGARPELQEVWNQLDAIKPKRAVFGGRRRRVVGVNGGLPVVPVAVAAGLPLVFGGAAVAAGLSSAAGVSLSLGFLTTLCFLFWPKVRMRWRSEERVLWGALPLIAFVGAVVTFLPEPAPTTWPALEQVKARAATLDYADGLSDPVARLRERAALLGAMSAEVNAELGDIPKNLRRDALSLSQELERRRLRLEAWAGARDDATGLAEAALTGRATLAALLRRGGPDPVRGPQGWGDWQRAQQEAFADCKAQLAEAQRVDPLSADLGRWRLAGRRLASEEAAWREATLNAGLEGARRLPNGRARLELLFELERLFPEEHLLGPTLTQTPVALPEFYDRRANLARGLARAGKLEAAQAVGSRLPPAHPISGQVREDLDEVLAARKAARELWNGAEALPPAERLTALRKAALVLSDDPALRAALRRFEAVAKAAADPSVEARRSARLTLWSGLRPDLDLVAWAEASLEGDFRPVGLVRLAVAIRALDGRVHEATELLDTLSASDLRAGPVPLDEALKGYELRLLAWEAARAKLAEDEERFLELPSGEARLRPALRAVLEARLELERAADGLRRAADPPR